MMHPVIHSLCVDLFIFIAKGIKGLDIKVGIIEVGLMGHGIALNVLKGAFSLVMMDHSGNQPTDDLTDMGAEHRDNQADGRVSGCGWRRTNG